MSIYAPAGAYLSTNLIGAPHPSRQCAMRIEFRGFVISIGMDNSCGSWEDMCRGEIRVFLPHPKDGIGADVSDRFGGAIYSPTGDDLFMLMQRIMAATS